MVCGNYIAAATMLTLSENTSGYIYYMHARRENLGEIVRMPQASQSIIYTQMQHESKSASCNNEPRQTKTDLQVF